GSTLTLKTSQLVLNTASVDGGALFNNLATATIVESGLTVNSAGRLGGAIANAESATLTVRDATLAENTASVGGAIFDGTGAATTPKVRRTTFARNQALTTGGAIHYTGATNGTMFILNSTLSANAANLGAAVFNTGVGGMFIANSTLYGQTTAVQGGAIHNNNNVVPLRLSNSIITQTTDSTGGPGADCFNDIFTSPNARILGGPAYQPTNLSDNCANTISLGPVTNLDPVLQDNGGPTETHQLLTGSNAIDKGLNNCPDPAAANAPLGHDQRSIA